MMKEEQVEGIKEGIERGFQELGFNLTTREKTIICLTVKSTVETIEHVLQLEE